MFDNVSDMDTKIEIVNDADSACSAFVVFSVRVNNLFTKQQLKERGISQHDMVMECLSDPADLVAKGEDLSVEFVAIQWPGDADQQ